MAKRIHYCVVDVIEDVIVLDDATRNEVTELTGCQAPDRALLRPNPFKGRYLIKETEGQERGEAFWETWKKNWAVEWNKTRYKLNRELRNEVI